MPQAKRIRQQPFAGKTVLIPGGSQGIGLAAAREVVQLGADVCIVAIGALEEARTEVEQLRVDKSQSVETILCDATDMDRLKPLLDEYIERRGVPD